MSRGGAREGAGRKSSWPMGWGFDETTTIRVPKYLSDRLLDIARTLDAETASKSSDTALEDLLAVESGIIGHQVNCQGVMNSGLAKQVRLRYPVVYAKYKEFVDSCEDKRELLGRIQPVRVSESLWVYNLFGQFGFGAGRHTDYDALKIIARKLRDRGLQVHLPRLIGCGLGGGDWDVVQDIFAIADIIWVGKNGRGV